MVISEKDWKLLRKKVPVWQENFIEKIIKEYSLILNSDKLASSKFWELEDRVFRDKKLTGVVIDMRRSRALVNVLNLIDEGAITIADLDDFSEEFRNDVKQIISMNNKHN